MLSVGVGNVLAATVAASEYDISSTGWFHLQASQPQTMMQQSSASAARAEVELDIYSGMPNPTWALSIEDARSLATRMASLPRTSDQRLHGNLGYRGFIIRLIQGPTAQEVRVQSGIVQVAEQGGHFYARDNNRASSDGC